MTPIIDIVFLLIIFFMLVCQFIVAENFEVTVPDEISAAESIGESEADKMTTVTVMFDDDGSVSFAVGAEVLVYPADGDIASAISLQIDSQLYHLAPERRVITLRIDKDIPYIDSQHAIAGISQSSATDIKLAAIKTSSLSP